MPFLGFIQVSSRYLLKYPAPWSEEMLRLAFVWSIFIGCSIGVKRNAHLGVEFLVRSLPIRIQDILFLMICLLCGMFSLYMAYTGLQLTLMYARIGTTLPVTGFPTSLATLAVPVGFLFTAIRFFLLVFEKITLTQFKNDDVIIPIERV